MTGVSLSAGQVKASFGDASVIRPEALRLAPPHWPVWELPDHDLNGGPTYLSELAKWLADPDHYTPPPPPDPP